MAPQPPASPGAKSSPQSDAAAVARLAVPETAGAAAKTAANDNPPGEAISMDPADSSGGVKNASPLSRRAQPAGVGKSPPAASRRPPAPFAWPEPETLLSQLDALASHATTSRWGSRPSSWSTRWGRRCPGGRQRRPRRCGSWTKWWRRRFSWKPSPRTSWSGKTCLRAHHALARRVDVWRHVCEVESPEASAAALPIADPQALAACLADVDRMLGDGPERAAWEEFLGLDKLRAWLAGRARLGPACSPPVGRADLASPGRDGHVARPAAIGCQGADGGLASGIAPPGGRTGPMCRAVAAPGDFRADGPARRRPAAGAGLPLAGPLADGGAGNSVRPSPPTIAMPTCASPSARSCSTGWSRNAIRSMPRWTTPCWGCRFTARA